MNKFQTLGDVKVCLDNIDARYSAQIAADPSNRVLYEVNWMREKEQVQREVRQLVGAC